jgi:hypothetical protein
VLISSLDLAQRAMSPAAVRRGSVAVLISISLVMFLGFVALAVDLGFLYVAYNQLQTCADAGAMAGASNLLDGTLFQGTPETPNNQVGQTVARTVAEQYAELNRVVSDFPQVDTNSSNSTSGDIVLGYLANPWNRSSSLDTSDPSKFNAVQVRVRRTSSINGPVATFFAGVFGVTNASMTAKSTAVMMSSVDGFKVTSETNNAGLLPFAVDVNSWNNLLSGVGSDLYDFDPGSETVTGGSDGLLELNMFPLTNGASGNFGTVDIGPSNNSTADLERQILSGVSAADLAYHGGSLRLGSQGTLVLNGDTGVSAGIKDELEAVRGKPRTIMLYSSVTGNGNNAMYTIVGFAGVRIVSVKLTGALSSKKIIVQPAVVVDPSATVSGAGSRSKYVYSNVRLVR